MAYVGRVRGVARMDHMERVSDSRGSSGRGNGDRNPILLQMRLALLPRTVKGVEVEGLVYVLVLYLGLPVVGTVVHVYLPTLVA